MRTSTTRPSHRAQSATRALRAPASTEGMAKSLLRFLDASPSPFHAAAQCATRLRAAGYQELKESDAWNLSCGGKYFTMRNGSTLLAFAVGNKYEPGNGVCAIGAHTDSPCPKLKPISTQSKCGVKQLAVQPYGGGLWYTWFDRDLGLAGRMLVRDKSRENADAKKLKHVLVHVDRPILRIPTLAIHLDRDVNSAGFKVDFQKHMPAVLAGDDPAGSNGNQVLENGMPKQHWALLECLAREAGCAAEDIADMELQLCDTVPGALGGLNEEFVFCGRLDNLCMSYLAIESLIDVTKSHEDLEEESTIRFVSLFDHEEVGSCSAQGAGSTVMMDTLRRIAAALGGSQEGAVERCLQNSLLVSADMAHAHHPNYMDRHEPEHAPIINKGVVIKHNANQRYATNSMSALLFREVARENALPIQEFVVRSDMACGSTIGPIIASNSGMLTVDVGIPQLSMHSVREMCGVKDVDTTFEHFRYLYKDFARLMKMVRGQS